MSINPHYSILFHLIATFWLDFVEFIISLIYLLLQHFILFFNIFLFKHSTFFISNLSQHLWFGYFSILIFYSQHSIPRGNLAMFTLYSEQLAVRFENAEWWETWICCSFYTEIISSSKYLLWFLSCCALLTTATAKW